MLRKTRPALCAAAFCLAGAAHAGVQLIAVGMIDGHFEDRSAETAAAPENGVAGNRLGGIGSADAPLSLCCRVCAAL